MRESNSKRSKLLRSSREGFTLVEMVVTMVIMALLATGLATASLQSRYMTEGSILQNTARTIAQGYIEQIKNMSFDSLDISPVPTLMNQGNIDSLDVSPSVSNPETGDTGTDVENVRFIDINNTPDDADDDMELRIVLYINNVTDVANGIGEARQIILRYTYFQRLKGSLKPISITIHTLRSEVPTF